MISILIINTSQEECKISYNSKINQSETKGPYDTLIDEIFKEIENNKNSLDEVDDELFGLYEEKYVPILLSTLCKDKDKFATFICLNTNILDYVVLNLVNIFYPIGNITNYIRKEDNLIKYTLAMIYDIRSTYIISQLLEEEKEIKIDNLSLIKNIVNTYNNQITKIKFTKKIKDKLWKANSLFEKTFNPFGITIKTFTGYVQKYIREFNEKNKERIILDKKLNYEKFKNILEKKMIPLEIECTNSIYQNIKKELKNLIITKSQEHFKDNNKFVYKNILKLINNTSFTELSNLFKEELNKQKELDLWKKSNISKQLELPDIKKNSNANITRKKRKKIKDNTIKKIEKLFNDNEISTKFIEHIRDICKFSENKDIKDVVELLKKNETIEQLTEIYDELEKFCLRKENNSKVSSNITEKDNNQIPISSDLAFKKASKETSHCLNSSFTLCLEEKDNKQQDNFDTSDQFFYNFSDEHHNSHYQKNLNQFNQEDQFISMESSNICKEE